MFYHVLARTGPSGTPFVNLGQNGIILIFYFKRGLSGMELTMILAFFVRDVENAWTAGSK